MGEKKEKTKGGQRRGKGGEKKKKKGEWSRKVGGRKERRGEKKEGKKPWPCPPSAFECHMHPPLPKPGTGVLHLLDLSVVGFLLCSRHLSWLKGSR